jgi:quercetin dioxygenase-like cupin family protein
MDSWNWPDSLDALTAASDFHTLLLETDDVRVLDTRIRPGDTTPVHTHRFPAVLFVLSGGHIVRRDGEGNVLLDTRDGEPIVPDSALWTDALPPHTVENVSDTEIRVVNFELKRR